jgi:alpha-tubulin suppressor-like RCC1 family protein
MISACSDDTTNTVSFRAPIYQGMTIASSLNAQTQAFESAIQMSFGINTSQSMSFDDEIEKDFDVIESDEIEYFANRNEDILINVRLINPDSQVILRFTLNSVTYQSFQFKEGSNSENLLLIVNAGDISGIKEFTIDEIKYIENDTNAVKDAVFVGDRTIKLGVTYDIIPEANVSDIEISSTSIIMNVLITDVYNIILNSSNIINAYVYDGTKIIQTKTLTLGNNNIVFNGLPFDSEYEYAIATIYDRFDGLGRNVSILRQGTLRTESILSVTTIEITNSSISFDLVEDDTDKVRAITEIELYQGDILIEVLRDLSLRTFTDLLSNKEYTIKVSYTYDLNDGLGLVLTNILLNFRTLNTFFVDMQIYDINKINTKTITLNDKEEIIEISSEFVSSAFLTNQGRLFVWGYNADSQLGNNKNQTVLFPEEITHLFKLKEDDRLIKIFMGENHSAALSMNNRIFIWGSGFYGQFGDGQMNHSSLPYEITDVIKNLLQDDFVIDITLGQVSTGILTNNGKVYMTGFNRFGIVGDGMNGSGSNNIQESFVDITKNFNFVNDEKIIKIKMGAHSVAALSNFGNLFTWGGHYEGILGTGSRQDSNLPVNVTNKLSLNEDEMIINFDIANDHMIIVTSQNRIFGWGSNRNNQLSKELEMDSYWLPQDITNQFLLENEEIILDINLSTKSSSVLTNYNRVIVLGDTFLTGEMTLNNILKVSYAQNHAIALDINNQLITWGSNWTGQLGNNSYQEINGFYTFDTLKPYSNFKILAIENDNLVDLINKYELNNLLWYLDYKFSVTVENYIVSKNIFIYSKD